MSIIQSCSRQIPRATVFALTLIALITLITLSNLPSIGCVVEPIVVWLSSTSEFPSQSTTS